ncbi:hypothetical protein BB561_004979 [Smittium simulii]|uniref:Uncharacterized protein n=1 Tax=Smittium simulii TaxID=133385 RepID=A0A2T9YCY8_9FUNG|nr:hypothetical protein BB561_004979 [Smittium simulii]
MGNNCGILILLRFMASLNDINSYKHQRIIRRYYALKLRSAVGCFVLVYSGNTKALAYAQKFGKPTSPKLLEVLEKLWLHCMKTITRPQIAYVPTYINPANAPSRLIAQTEFSLSTETFKKLEKIFGPHDVDLFATMQSQKPIMLLTMESDTANTTKGITKEDNNDNNNSDVEVGNLVFGSTKNQDSIAYTNTEIRDYSRSKKRKIFILQEQIVVTNSTRNQRCALQKESLTNTKYFKKTLTVDSISRIIKSIAIMAIKNKRGSIPKARAIEATIAAITGISTDAILSQAN